MSGHALLVCEGRPTKYPECRVNQQQTIKLNGQSQNTPPACSITELLMQLEITNPAIAIELNGEIVSAADFGSRKIQEGDEVEIVSFVGGG